MIAPYAEALVAAINPVVATIGAASLAVSGDTRTDAKPLVAPLKKDNAGETKAKDGEKTNPFAGSVDKPVVVVNPDGVAIPVAQGEKSTGSKDGKAIQVRDADNNYTGRRLDKGHKQSTHPNNPEAWVPHVHIPGMKNWLPPQ